MSVVIHSQTAAAPALAVLLVEDDAGIGGIVTRGLANHAIDVDWLRDGESLIDSLRQRVYGAVVLDLMLPGADGFELCRRLRSEGFDLPVCMLTARDALQDKLDGFDCGADDYLTKPFEIEELAARLKALSRRRFSHSAKSVIAHGDLTLTADSREVRVGDAPLILTRREFDVLALLLARAGSAISREDFLDAVWSGDRHVTLNTVDVYMGYLRRKLAAAASGVRIDSVRGVGFKLV